MTQRYFETDNDYHQSALAYAAFAIYEYSSDAISDGVIADVSEAALFHLIEIARSKSFDQGTKNAIGMYANLVQDENNFMRAQKNR